MKIGLFYDWDLTLTEEYQQMPIFRKYFENIKKKYNFSLPEDYFSLCKGSELGISYMEPFLKDVKETFEGINNEKMKNEFASQQRLSEGLPDWFERINSFAKDYDLEIEHHVISVGILPLIEGTCVAPFLSSIHAGEFIEQNNQLIKIKKIINPFRKVEVLKSILKKENFYKNIPLESYHILPQNSIVFGDGQSDLDIFRYVKQRGGYSIAVFEKGNNKEYLQRINDFDMVNSENAQINLLAPRDYSKGGILESKVQETILNIKKGEEICDLDYHIVHSYKIGKIQNLEIKKLAEEHFDSCSVCQNRWKPQALFN
jgi:hypothetical protein